MQKTVLVVDDSRVAIMGLARLLKAEGLLVDSAESGPEALDYLRLNPPPAAIFLDHMMPGMDGFETLRALKSAPTTAAIPVIMYTSKDGEAYMHEAQSLGAVGVLLKPPQPSELQRLLASLRERAETRTEPKSNGTPAARPAPAPVAPAPTVATSPSVTAIGADETPPSAAPRRGLGVFVALTLALLLIAGGWALMQFEELELERDQLRIETRELKAEIGRLALESARLQEAQAAAEREAAERAASRGSGDPQQPLYDAIAWALNEQGHYDFGELPFSDRRLQLLRGLIARLTELDFRGEVRFDSHLGEFCVVRDRQGRPRLPPPATPLSACERMSYPPGEAVRLAQRQSAAFARYVAEHASANTPIAIRIVSHGTARPLQEFHPSVQPQTAADWNAVARRNQRVVISLIPQPAS